MRPISRAMLAILLMLVSCLPVMAQQGAGDILIVVDSRVPGQQKMESELRQLWKAGRESTHTSSATLPIDTYDLRNEGHRTAAQRLHISPRDCPYLAFAMLDRAGGRPDKILSSVARVANAREAVAQLGRQLRALQGPSTSKACPICGVWKQYAPDANGQMVYVLTVRNSEGPGGYGFTVLDIGPQSSIKNASDIHVSNITVDGDEWTFDSDWGTQGIAHFVLEKETADRWSGWAYLNGTRVMSTVWTRTGP
jgi:hypothetical protein